MAETTKTRPRVLGEDALLKTSEVAKLLRCTAEEVRRMINAGRLPAVRPTHHFCVWRSDVERLVKQAQIGS